MKNLDPTKQILGMNI